MKEGQKKYVDTVNNRLVYVSNEADNRYWDMHWQSQNREKLLARPPKHNRIVGLTKKYLPAGSRILEGGCGLGDKVRALKLAGFNVTGIDYAEETLEWIGANWGDLDARKDDVRELSFDDDTFDGYWSLGVIEHFYFGYDEIAREMRRVLRPGKYLFLTFPMMSKVRLSNAKKNKYEQLEDVSTEPQGFYQFALDPSSVIENFENAGFQLLEHRGIGSLMGIEQEMGFLGTLANQVKKLPFGAGAKLNFLLDPTIGKSVGHMSLMVFKNGSNPESGE